MTLNPVTEHDFLMRDLVALTVAKLALEDQLKRAREENAQLKSRLAELERKRD